MSLLLESLSFFSMLAVLVILIWRVLANSGASLSKTIPELTRHPSPEPNFKESSQIFGYAMLFR